MYIIYINILYIVQNDIQIDRLSVSICFYILFSGGVKGLKISQEKIRSCKFKILNAQLADDVVLRGGGLLAFSTMIYRLPKRRYKNNIIGIYII